MTEKLLKYENAKLKHQLIFNLPVSKAICGRQCPGCYALKAQVRFPKTVLPYRERMHAASLQDDFTTQIIAEITKCKRPLSAVRIHEAGEFYSQAYIDKWVTIAKACPTVKIYTFTKRIKEFNFKALMALPNTSIVDSLMHGGLNYGPIAKLNPAVKICPSTSCGIQCTYCMSKAAQANGIQFVAH